ncbi:MAG: GntR family transcriptional regulator [SAR324 cluster bacterium]|nr:GntR family transcriptional regulator [SAR324 cluster bacterium]
MKKSLNTVASSTYESLKHDIIFGILVPGMKLKLSPLKRQYSASVSTLRETLNRLASEGFVSAEEQRGFFVAAVSRDDLVEIANLRILLESHALKASIENGDAEWEGNIVAAHHKLKLAEERMLSGDQSQKETWKRYDWEFHQAMIQACNSRNLLSLHATIFDKYLRYQMQVLTFRGQVAAGEHKKMLEAVLKRDTKGAQKILEDHILGGLKHSMSAF